MSEQSHVQVLRNIRQACTTPEEFHTIVSETRTGVHINLSSVSDQVIAVLSNYVQYADLQEQDLKKAEDETALIKNTHFSQNA